MEQHSYEPNYYREGAHVKILSSRKSNYVRDGVVGQVGVIVRTKSNISTSIPVNLTEMHNTASAKGVYWFHADEIMIVEDIEEELEMVNSKYSQIVRAVYPSKRTSQDEERCFGSHNIVKKGDTIVVKARTNERAVVATVTEVYTPTDYFNYEEGRMAVLVGVVQGVVDTAAYDAVQAEEARIKELNIAKAKAEIALKQRVEKLKNMQFYEEMVKQFADKDPELTVLLGTLNSIKAELGTSEEEVK